jgi:hypothetical protein
MCAALGSTRFYGAMQLLIPLNNVADYAINPLINQFYGKFKELRL